MFLFVVRETGITIEPRQLFAANLKANGLDELAGRCANWRTRPGAVLLFVDVELPGCVETGLISVPLLALAKGAL